MHFACVDVSVCGCMCVGCAVREKRKIDAAAIQTDAQLLTRQRHNKNQTTVRCSTMFWRYIFQFSCLWLSPRFSNTVVLKGIVQRSQHVRHDKAFNLLFIILFPLSSCPSKLYIFFSVCSRQCDLRHQPAKPITQTPLTDKVSTGKRYRQCFLMFL